MAHPNAGMPAPQYYLPQEVELAAAAAVAATAGGLAIPMQMMGGGGGYDHGLQVDMVFEGNVGGMVGQGGGEGGGGGGGDGGKGGKGKGSRGGARKAQAAAIVPDETSASFRKKVRTRAVDPNSVQQPRPYGCPVEGCTYTASRSGALVSHMRSHNGEKKFACDYPGCEYRAMQSSDVKKHARIHMGMEGKI